MDRRESDEARRDSSNSRRNPCSRVVEPRPVRPVQRRWRKSTRIPASSRPWRPASRRGRFVSHPLPACRIGRWFAPRGLTRLQYTYGFLNRNRLSSSLVGPLPNSGQSKDGEWSWQR